MRPRQLSSVKHSSSFVSLNKVSAHASSPKHFTCLMFVKEARRQLSSPMQETSIGLSVSSNSPLLTNEASEHEPSSTQSMLLQSVNSTPRQRTHLRVVNSREYVASSHPSPIADLTSNSEPSASSDRRLTLQPGRKTVGLSLGKGVVVGTAVMVGRGVVVGNQVVVGA